MSIWNTTNHRGERRGVQTDNILWIEPINVPESSPKDEFYGEATRVVLRGNKTILIPDTYGNVINKINLSSRS
jgi:hypothetical protein